MKLKLPLVGEIATGKDAQVQVVEVKQPSKGLSHPDILADVVQWRPNRLTTEKTASQKLLEANVSWVYKNNDVIATEVSKVKFQLFKVIMRAGKMELEELEDHPLLEQLDRFNDSNTKYDGIYLTQSHIKLVGDSFWLIEGRPPNIRNIFLLPPTKVTVNLGDFTKGSRRLIESYTYEDTVDGKTISVKYDPKEIVHIKAPNPNNMYRGLGGVEAAAQDVDIDTFSIETVRKFYENGGIFDFILTTEKSLNDEQRKSFHSQLRSLYLGVKNAFKVPIFSGGIKPESIQPTHREMEQIKQQQWTRDKIASLFGNPKSIITTDDVNRANAEATINLWKESTIAPAMGTIVNAINEYLVPKYGDNLILGFEDPVPENRDAKVKEAIQLKQAKIISQNEAREMLDYDPVDGGDVFDPINDIIPRSLKYIDYNAHCRRLPIYKQYKLYKGIYKDALKIVRKKRKQVKDEPVREHTQFSNEKIFGYWEKQIHVVEVQEERFKNAANQFIERIIDHALLRLPEEFTQMQDKQLIDESRMLKEAFNIFNPILTEVMVMAGQEANKLIGVDSPYIPTGKTVDTRESLREQIELFATSLIDTDKELLTDIIAQGIAEGLSVPQIRARIQDKFAEFSKTQAERVTRTEVLKSSNLGAQDAFEQSGVVEGKQWFTAEDDRVDPICASLNGTIVDLGRDYFKKGDIVEAGGKSLKLDYSNTPYPPIHPQCRCVILPVLVGERGFSKLSIEKEQDYRIKLKEQQKKINELSKL